MIISLQTGFREGRSCTDPLLKSPTLIKAALQEDLETSAAFIDLTPVHDTVWTQGLLYKFLKTNPNKNSTSEYYAE